MMFRSSLNELSCKLDTCWAQVKVWRSSRRPADHLTGFGLVGESGEAAKWPGYAERSMFNTHRHTHTLLH